MSVPAFVGSSDRLWDELWLGGVKIPGIAAIGGAGVKRKLDIKNPKGLSGATMVDEGDELIRVEITIKLWTAEQWDAFMAILPDIQPRKKGGPKSPLDIYHPASKAIGLNAVYIESLAPPQHSKREGTVTWTMGAIEWVPAPKPQPKAVGKNGGKGDKAKDKDHGPLGELIPYDDPDDDFNVLKKQPNPGADLNVGYYGNETDVAGSEDAVNDNFGD